MNETVEAGTASAPEQAGRKRGKPRFFQIMTALLLLAVLAGFAPTFFLRPFTGYGGMHWYLWVHGLVLTAWFVLCLVQTSLVTARRIDLHRRLGMWGAWLAGAVVLVGLYVLWAAPHDIATGTSGQVNPAVARMDGGPFLNAFGGLALFVIFVATAIIRRRSIETHRRLMLMASIAIIFPAAGRIPLDMLFWLQFPGLTVAIVGGGIALAYVLGMPIALLVYDCVTRRRPHRTTVIALVIYFPMFVSQFLFANAPVVQAAITALE